MAAANRIAACLLVLAMLGCSMGQRQPAILAQEVPTVRSPSVSPSPSPLTRAGGGASPSPSTPPSGITGTDPLAAGSSPAPGSSSATAPNSSSGIVTVTSQSGSATSPLPGPGNTTTGPTTNTPLNSTPIGSTILVNSPATGTTGPRSAPVIATPTGTTSGPTSSTGNNTGIGFVLPTPDLTSIDGVEPNREDCAVNALFNYLGAGGTAAAAGCNSSSSSSSTGSSGGGSFRSQFNAYTFAEARSSNARKEGLWTGPDETSFCVSHDGAVLTATADNNGFSFSSVAEGRTGQADYDPACEDPAALYRPGCLPRGPSFQDTDSSSSSSNNSSSSDSAAGSPSPDPSLSPSPAPLDFSNCTRGFLLTGSQPRSLAIVLIKWGRSYYKTKEQCCQEQNNVKGCDCKWGGRTFDNLPPPKAYSRLMTDECDQAPSVNRAYFDHSGGRVTFHSKLRIPVPAGSLAPVPSTGNNGTNGTDGFTITEAVATAAVPPSPYVVPAEPAETANSYLDPDGIDVYGWATLDGMRTEDGQCRDWCAEAMAQLGVKATDYNHIVCYALMGSRAICDTCAGVGCANTCPVETGITKGCGCGTCYYAWGGQTSCNRPAPAGIRIGLAASTNTYAANDASVAGGECIKAGEGFKMYMAHELGHNMGLTHAGGIKCKIRPDSDIIEREPVYCVPDWYGDQTSYMGSGGTLQIPNAIKYKVRWLPRATLKTHTPGTEAIYVLTSATSRRPSWQQSDAGNPLRWFSQRDSLTVRVPLRSAETAVSTTSYSCPCKSSSNCPACSPTAGLSACAQGPCCTDQACADGLLDFLYIELHQPYKNDYKSAYKGIAIRMMGKLSACTSTRQVPTHVEDGNLKYLLNKADPTGVQAGSRFEDTFRGVRITLERWDRARAVVRVWSA